MSVCGIWFVPPYDKKRTKIKTKSSTMFGINTKVTNIPKITKRNKETAVRINVVYCNVSFLRPRKQSSTISKHPKAWSSRFCNLL